MNSKEPLVALVSDGAAEELGVPQQQTEDDWYLDTEPLVALVVVLDSAASSVPAPAASHAAVVHAECACAATCDHLERCRLQQDVVSTSVAAPVHHR
mmetsp:Transcript_7944/g.14452  ORF Transcript_7944/g.14452 Transcript_7944/m.14452 type:complete len:97 (+) Transcript_7944:908-1198(+)